MKNRFVLHLLGMLLIWLPLFLTTSSINAQQNCTVPTHDNVADGSTVYASGLCNQARVDQWWGVFNMQKEIKEGGIRE